MLLADVPAPPPFARPAAVVEDGRSVEGRELRLVRQGAADAPRRVLVVGALHGDEPGGRRVVSALRATPAPIGTAVFSIADLNPDGSRRRRRTNAHGVDLNRNFPANWRRGSPGRFCPGPSARSEPEPRWLVRSYVRRVRRSARTLPRHRGTATTWQHRTYPGTSTFVVELPERRPTDVEVGRHVRAIHALLPGD